MQRQVYSLVFYIIIKGKNENEPAIFQVTPPEKFNNLFFYFFSDNQKERALMKYLSGEI